jgi:sugar-specific transcriptional regulator TrmB
MNTEALKQIGLTEGEAKVYLALLKLGSVTSGPLTDESQVSRSKIYNVLERLMQKGLVSFILKNKTRYFQAVEPARIEDYLEQKEAEFKKQKQELEKILPQLEMQRKLGEKIKEAQIFKGFKGVQAVHEKIFSNLKKGEEYFYMGIPALQDEKYRDYWDKMHMKRIEAGIKCKLLYNQGTDKNLLKKRNKQKGCEARFMFLPINIPAWIMGYKDVLSIGVPSEEGLAIEITNQKIADAFKEYFESFWKLSKPFKK